MASCGGCGREINASQKLCRACRAKNKRAKSVKRNNTKRSNPHPNKDRKEE